MSPLYWLVLSMIVAAVVAVLFTLRRRQRSAVGPVVENVKWDQGTASALGMNARQQQSGQS